MDRNMTIKEAVKMMQKCKAYLMASKSMWSVEEVAEAFDMVIEALSADTVQDWIPCSEKLPEDGIAVLTTTENEEVYIDRVITDPFKERYFQNNTAFGNYQVVAWMPLPEPYKGGDE